MTMCTVKDVFSVVTPIGTLLVALWAATIATRGLKTWQRQLVGQADHDLAKRTTLAAIRLREAISSYRAYTSHGDEVDETAAAPQPRSYDRRERSRAWADRQFRLYQRRWKSVAEVWAVFETCKLEAEALWDIEELKGFESLRIVLVELRAATYEYVDLLQSESPAENAKRMLQLKQVLFPLGTRDDPDDLTLRIDEAIDELKKQIRPRLPQRQR